MNSAYHRIFDAPVMLAMVGGAVTSTLHETPTMIALIGGGAVVVAQVVIAIGAARNARLARDEARLAREAVVAAAKLAAERDVKIAEISHAVDGQLTGARQEIASLRGELARVYPGNVRVQQQADNATRDAKMQAESVAKP
jgi:hypothetical protein